MRVVLYAHHSLFEPALSLTAALAGTAEVHLVLEVPAGRWQAASFTAPADLESASGPVPADPILAGHFPPETRAMWRAAASFSLVVTGAQRSRHPVSLRLMRRTLAWIARLEPDVLHVDDADVSPRLALALATARLPFAVVVGCHDPEPHSGEDDWPVKRLARRLLFTRSDAVVVHHRAGAAALRRRHPRLRRPIATVPLASYAFVRHAAAALPAAGAAAPAPAPGPPPTVLLFGRITPYKGLTDLFGAAPLVARAVPGVRFLVAGAPVPGYEPPPVPVLARGGTVETRYRYVPNDETAEIFGQATVTVCPYTDASQSGVVLTAQAFGCPVVVTDVGGLPEYVQDGVTGLVVPPADPVALAAALVRALTEPGLLEHLRSGVAAATAQGWAPVASGLLAVYSRAVADRGRRRPWRRRA